MSQTPQTLSRRASDPRGSYGELPTAPEIAERTRTVAITAAATVFAIGIAYGLAFLGYALDQATHRLFKIAAVAVLAGLFMARPRWLPYVICLVLPFGEWLPVSPVPFLNTANLLVLGSLLAVLVLALRGETRVLIATPLNLPIFLFLAWLMLSWYYGEFIYADRWIGGIARFKYVWGIISGFLVFFVVLPLVRDRRALWRLVAVLLLSGALAVIGPLQETIRDGWGKRTAGGLGDINKMGAYLAMAAVFALCMFPAYKAWKKLGGAIAALLPAAAMILPNSRGAYVAFLIGAVPQVLRTNVAGGAILVAVVLSGALWAPSFVQDRVAQVWQAAASEDRQTAIDIESGGRLSIWRDAADLIVDHPLIGVGYGNLSVATGIAAGNYKHAHNLYIEVAGQMGFPGLFLLLWIFFRAWRLGSAIQKRGGRGLILGRAYHGAILTLLIANIFGTRFLDFGLTGFFFLLSAVVALEERLTRPRLAKA
ncbi:MAG: O-antigen ligase family protein [Candidatus Eisenbacteria bacterium]|nr:O-antigen ligase family protein [Candidatus Eisenbacteria bacterium]